jgi:hypothetical protein
MKKWILVDIGCIECGEKSRVVGFYDSQAEAEKFWEEKYIQPKRRRRVQVGGQPWELSWWGREEWHGEHHSLIEEVTIPK